MEILFHMMESPEKGSNISTNWASAFLGTRGRLHIGHIKDKSLGGKDELSNLHALSAACNQGAKNVTGEKPTWIWLKAQIKRAGQDDQRDVYEWLRTKFGDKG